MKESAALPRFQTRTTSMEMTMSYFTTTNGTRLFYKDWGVGQPILFAHG